MRTYIGTKIVKAERMDEGTFQFLQRGSTTGTLKEPRAGYQVIYEDGYVSWSPADVFERCYREVSPAEAALLVPVAESS